MIELTDTEKLILEKIASSDNRLLAKRAVIILMSGGDNLPTNIAKEVELTPRTVRRWQREFEQKRMAIFPYDGPIDDGNQSLSRPMELVASPETAKSPRESKVTKPSSKKKSKKDKRKEKKREAIIYATRKTIGLEPTDALAEAGRKVLGFHFAKMLQHEPGTRLGEDIEELHDMRVATRRMRAAFRVFGPGFSKKAIKPLLAGLKETGRALGPVRDLDVFMEKLQRYQQSLPESDRAGLQSLLDMWRSKQEPARKKMLVYLDSKKYLKFKRTFLEFVETKGLGAKPIPTKIPPVPYQLRHIAPSLIYAAYEEVRAYESVLDNAPIETLHQLRLSFKKFRYTLEYLQEILGDERKKIIKEVKGMQDHLGDMNDADVASVILRDFLAEWEQHQLHLPLKERQSPTQIVTYLNSKLNERHQLLVSFPQAWAHFNRFEFRQNLAMALSVL
jgi:CHAD domain-containing protein